MSRGRLVVGLVMLPAMGLVLMGCEACNLCKPKEKCPTKYTKSDCKPNWSKCRQDGSMATKDGMTGQPMRQGYILDVARNTPTLSTFSKAIRSANLASRFRSGGPYTVFAPSDEAFNKLPAGMLDDLMRPENKARLQSILLYHVTGGDLFTPDITGSRRISTLQGEPIRIANRNGTILADNARVIEPNLQAKNGVIHVVDTVLMPPGEKWQGSAQPNGGSQDMAAPDAAAPDTAAPKTK